MNTVVVRAILLSVSLLGLSQTGCASMIARGYLPGDFQERPAPPYFFRGIALKVADPTWEHLDEEPVFLLPIGLVFELVDWPLSLVADVVLLPVDAVVWLGRRAEAASPGRPEEVPPES